VIFLSLYLKNKSEKYLKLTLFGLARVPAARIKQYTQEKYGGPDDIALVRTKTTVIFEPGLVMPVGVHSCASCGELRNFHQGINPFPTFKGRFCPKQLQMPVYNCFIKVAYAGFLHNLLPISLESTVFLPKPLVKYFLIYKPAKWTDPLSRVLSCR
jgi:hypothetical protein